MNDILTLHYQTGYEHGFAAAQKTISKTIRVLHDGVFIQGFKEAIDCLKDKAPELSMDALRGYNMAIAILEEEYSNACDENQLQ